MLRTLNCWTHWCVVALSVLVVSLTACGEDPADGDDQQDECDVDCDIGDTQCDGDGAVQACTTIDGCPAWTEASQCGGDEVCEEGQCVDDDCEVDCQLGESQCDGDGVTYCIDVDGCPAWSDPSDCGAGATCQDGQCTEGCDNECADGETVCDGDDSFQVCQQQADGCYDWSAPIDCSEGLNCEDGQCVVPCSDQCDNEGDTRCDGAGGYQTCQEQPDGCLDWSDGVDCDAETICSGGECVPGDECVDACTDGETTCDGDDGYLVCEMQDTDCLDWSSGATCSGDEICEDGQCVDDCTDQCADGESRCEGDGVEYCQLQIDGCYDWSDPIACAEGTECDDGACVTTCEDECTEGESRCGNGGVELCQEESSGCTAWTDPVSCPEGTTCSGGQCLDDDEDACSEDNPDGKCPDGQTCDDGECISEECSEDNPDGSCPAGEICDDGDCVESELCNCAPDEVCVDGQCHPEDDACSTDNPDGLCDSGFDCIEGECTAGDDECSSDNPDGICPVGEWCDEGTCVDLDEGLCTDRNDCTDYWFDYDYNLCLTEPNDANSCDDGNACTDNWCDGGECVAEVIDGCEMPPKIDPYPSRTDENNPVISGTKPEDTDIEVNGDEINTEFGSTDWSFEPTLVGNETNVYDIRWVDSEEEESEIQTVEIYYDTDEPETTATPGSGTFLDGIIVEVTTDEPADVFYTTDGSTPTASSKSFRSIRQFRIFEPTELRFRARDDAGNWEQEVTEVSYDITSYANRWSDEGPVLEDGTLRDAAATAADDTVYLAGGSSGGSERSSVKTWDVDDETWSDLPSLSSGRDEASMIHIDGRLYIVGGQNDGDVSSMLESIDPESDSDWQSLQGMPTNRRGLEAVAWKGEIYAFGGKSSGGTVEDILHVYDPDADSWSDDYEQMPTERYDFEAVLHRDLIYLFGGVDDAGDRISTVDVYDPESDSWSTTAAMPTARSGLAAGVLKGRSTFYNASVQSTIVVAGGVDETGDPTPVVEEYDPATDSWTTRTPMNEARYAGATVDLDVPFEPGDRHRELWILGGETADGEQDSTAVYTRDLEFLRHLSEMPAPRFDHSAASWNGRLYVVGGEHEGSRQDVWAFDPETGSYIEMEKLPEIQNGLGMAAVGPRVYAIGGENQYGDAVTFVHALDPVENDWTEREPMPSNRRDPAVTEVGDKIYVIGGYGDGSARQTVEIYDPDEDTWESGPLLEEARAGAMVTVHDGDIYVFGGEDSDGNPRTSYERLEEGADSWEIISRSNITDQTFRASHGAAFSLGEDLIAVIGDQPSLDGDLYIYNTDTERGAEYSEVLPGYDRAATTAHHGRLYTFGGNTDSEGPDSTTRKYHLHGCVPASTALMPGWCTGTGFHDDLFLVDYSPGTAGSGASHWRGYRFTVSTPVTLTSVYGGGNESTFGVALYEANGDTPTELIAEFESGERRGENHLDDWIILEPGQDYVIAQGEQDGGDHYWIEDPIDYQAIEDETVIETWNPLSPGEALLWGANDDAYDLLYDSPSATSSTPDMGLGIR